MRTLNQYNTGSLNRVSTVWKTAKTIIKDSGPAALENKIGEPNWRLNSLLTLFLGSHN